MLLGYLSGRIPDKSQGWDEANISGSRSDFFFPLLSLSSSLSQFVCFPLCSISYALESWKINQCWPLVNWKEDSGTFVFLIAEENKRQTRISSGPVGEGPSVHFADLCVTKQQGKPGDRSLPRSASPWDDCSKRKKDQRDEDAQSSVASSRFSLFRPEMVMWFKKGGFVSSQHSCLSSSLVSPESNDAFSSLWIPADSVVDSPQLLPFSAQGPLSPSLQMSNLSLSGQAPSPLQSPILSEVGNNVRLEEEEEGRRKVDCWPAHLRLEVAARFVNHLMLLFAALSDGQGLFYCQRDSHHRADLP